MKYALALIIGLSLFLSCRYLGGKRIRGDGNQTTEQRSVSGFDGVQTLGSFDIILTSSNDESVKVEAEENLLPYIETIVEDHKLQIRTKKGYNLRPNSDIKVYISGPTYRTIESSGSGNISSQNALNSSKEIKLNVSGSGNINVEVNVEKLSAEIAGSGNLHISGTAKEFNTGIYGSGSIKAGELKTDETTVEIAGSGNAEVFANNKLNIKVMGSGDVRHRGGAQVSSYIAGSGSVIKVD